MGRLSICIVATVLFWAAGSSSSEGQVVVVEKPDVAEHAFHVASALSEAFETVVYVQSELLPQNGADASRQSYEELRFATLPYEDLFAAVDKLGPGVRNSLLAGSSAWLVGATDLRHQAIPHSTRVQNCYVVVLEPNSKFDLRRYFLHAPIGSIAGFPLWRFDGTIQEVLAARGASN